MKPICALVPAMLLFALTFMSEIRAVAGPRASSIVWEPKTLSFGPECATTFWLERRPTLCIIEPVLDSSGRLHVFLGLTQLDSSVSVAPRIEHLLLIDDEVQVLPALSLEHAPVNAFRAAATNSGDIELLWVEQEYFDPKYHPRSVYLATYRYGAWVNRRQPLDDQAKPWVSTQDDLALLSHADGSLDLFWKDLREHHPIVSFFTMGHGGDYPKTYHRRFNSRDWGEVTRVQRKGTFWPSTFRVLSAGSEVPEVYWSESVGSAALVSRSVHSPARWSVDRVGKCKSPLGNASVYTLEVAGDGHESRRVAWVCGRYEHTEPGTRKSDHFDTLYVSAYDGKSWKSSSILSRNVSSMRWLWSDSSRGDLLVQSLVRYHDGRPKQTPVPLYVETIEGVQSLAKATLSDQTIQGVLEAVTGRDGTIHVIYAEPTSDTEAVLKYRRGRHINTSQLSPSQ